MSALSRFMWPWGEPAADITRGRIMCGDCKFHSAAMAGREWDRCRHPDADDGSIIRNSTPKCIDMRSSSLQCGRKGQWFQATMQTLESL